MFKEVKLEDIYNAKSRIEATVAPTPCIKSQYFSKMLGFSVYLKLENLNLSGSFKIRGAMNAITSQNLQGQEIICASAGNHAQGVAFVCQSLGLSARIFMPERTPQIKVSATEGYGSKVVLGGAVFDDAFEAAKAYAKENPCVLIHPYNDFHVIAGQGTVALELIEQVKDMTSIIVPIGGGGLISGVAIAIKAINPSIRVYGVQVENYTAMADRFQTKASTFAQPPKPQNLSRSLADGIAVKTAADYNYSFIEKYVDDVFVVSEEEIARSVMELMERERLLVEGAGAASVAAMKKFRSQINVTKGGRVVPLITGGNIDASLLKRIIDKALMASDRMLYLSFLVDDRPGALANVLGLMAKMNVNILQVQHDRLFGSASYAETRVDALVETSGTEHRHRLVEAMRESGIRFLNEKPAGSSVE